MTSDDDTMTPGVEAREPIRGKVARIADAYSVFINRGSNHGVREGMKFEVYDPEWTEIIDPDSLEVIGEVPVLKATLEATEVHESMSKLETFKRVVYGGGIGSMASLLGSGPRVEERQKISFAGKSMAQEEKPIAVGDVVEEA